MAASSEAGTSNLEYARGLARAFAGALIFGLPLLMTMEMWSIGLYVHPFRLILFLLIHLGNLVLLSRFGGFEPTCGLKDDVLDALAAYAVGNVSAALILALLGLITADMPLNEVGSMIALQSVPASFGAMIARKQLSSGEMERGEEQDARSGGYAGELFLMVAGALFFAFNIAPTEEVVLISFKMTPWHCLGLIIFSILILHALVFTVGFAGEEEGRNNHGALRSLLVFTIPGYAIALGVSVYVLWTFGRIDVLGWNGLVASAVVLGFPASIGAAIARLVV